MMRLARVASFRVRGKQSVSREHKRLFPSLGYNNRNMLVTSGTCLSILGQ